MWCPQILDQLTASRNDQLAAFAINARGDIFLATEKKRDAVLMYLRTALLMPKENRERPKALLKVANLLKEMNDNRAANFANMLRTDYPDNSLIKELK